MLSLAAETQSMPGKEVKVQAKSTVCDITNMYNCKGTTKYIDMSQKCDYSHDCWPHGDDEEDCTCKLPS